MNYKVIDFIFFLICCSLPFSMIPLDVRFVLFGSFGNHLLSYPIFVGFCYTIYCHYKYRNVFVDFKRVLRFLLIYGSVLIFSVVVGLYNFPYYEDVLTGPVSQVSRIPVLMKFISDIGIRVTTETVLKCFMFIRPIRDVFVDIFYMYGTSYLIYCWYNRRLQRATDILCKATKCIVPVLIGYGIVEIFSLSGVMWCKELLGFITPYIIECHNDAWPPLFWYSKQIRLLFAEPSFIGNYLAILLPVMLYMYFTNKENIYISLFSIFGIFILVFVSKARTATAMAFGVVGLYLIILLLVYKCIYLKKGIVLVCVILCSFVLSLKVIDFINNQGSQKATALSGVTMEQYVEDNVSSVVSTNKRSNGARIARLKSNLRVGMEHPILGVGRGLITPYAIEKFTEEEKDNWEVKRWLEIVNNEGLLKHKIGAMNEYVERFAETGILGLLLFLYPFTVILIRILNLIMKVNNMEYICLFVTLVSSLVSGFNIYLNVIYGTWIVLGLCFSVMHTGKDNKY